MVGKGPRSGLHQGLFGEALLQAGSDDMQNAGVYTATGAAPGDIDGIELRTTTANHIHYPTDITTRTRRPRRDGTYAGNDDDYGQNAGLYFDAATLGPQAPPRRSLPVRFALVGGFGGDLYRYVTFIEMLLNVNVGSPERHLQAHPEHLVQHWLQWRKVHRRLLHVPAN